MSEEINLNQIFKNTSYDDTIFSKEEKENVEKRIFKKKLNGTETIYIKCLKRKKDFKITPEEVVRQLYLEKLTGNLDGQYGYILERIDVEEGVSFGREVKRADIIIYDKDVKSSAYIIIEVKKTNARDGKEQLKSYCHATGSPMAVWTNGKKILYYHRKDPNYFEPITDIPKASSSLKELLDEKFTYAKLQEIDKLNQQISLKETILDMEDEVLANAGVDVFEEVFKLVFSKLFDELTSYRNKRIFLRFRNSGETDSELKEKINNLFDEAKKKWHGVFDKDTKINLSPSHLAICVSSLQDKKLFNSNLDVVDDAFEYLIGKSSKGEKGQYFTPRYVIDMCVKMLNPQEHETIIDTASGSSGFTIHTIFDVWKKIRARLGKEDGIDGMSAAERLPEETDYVQSKVFSIDFDEKAVRVARTLNLIAGDGETNVLHLNTLDYKRWDEWTKAEAWNKTYNAGFEKLKDLRADEKSFKEFNFDILMANPPFAGDIKEGSLLSLYLLGKNSKGKAETKVGRDILFIERNLNFLKPGGRMAIVLPQGRFNNSSDLKIREFISERARILAVVGLHGNTFKPHTGTKTSVLFVQKWDKELCPKVEDYNIFFATMQESGKDNSGEKIYVLDKNGERVTDSHGHLIVKHDLFNHDGKTQDGIAEAFAEFAKKERLSFF
ncbi:MAG: N-6 DNA methylase [Fusobacteriaceae bacterium]